MINLLRANIDLNKAKQIHWEFFEAYVHKRLNGKKEFSHLDSKYSNLPKQRYSPAADAEHFKEDLKDFVLENNNLKTIIIGTPDETLSLHNDIIQKTNTRYGPESFKNYMNCETKKEQEELAIHGFIKDINALFNYKAFSTWEPHEGYNAYSLAKILNVRACAFCNRTFTVTRTDEDGGKLMRPQFDHWFPKSKYPLLAVSFYNLIPCCNTCNSSVKGDTDLDPDHHIHPYIDTDMDFSFDYYNTSLNEYKVYLKQPPFTSSKGVDTIKALKVDQMYNAHIPELEDLIKIKKAYGKEYIGKMAAFFPKTGLSEEEVYRLLFGVELEEKNYHKRPMSKFKHDILKELGIIK